MKRLPLFLLALGVFFATAAEAHQYWLAPSRYQAAARQRVAIGALAGTGFRGERKPWAPGRCVRFIARATRDLDLTVVAQPGELSWAEFSPADDGGALVAFESDFVPIQLPAGPFDSYLAGEGLDQPLAARRHLAAPREGRERYRRCAKTWLAGRDTARATRPVGMPLEIVPLGAPGASAALRVRVLWMGRPLAGSLVKTWRAPLGADGGLSDPEGRDSVATFSEARTDARGEVALRIESPGEWLVSTVHMVPSSDPREADWESTWASLTFVRPATVGAGK